MSYQFLQILQRCFPALLLDSLLSNTKMLGHQEIKKKPRNPRGDLWLQLDICEKLLESFNDLMNAEAAAAAAPEAQEGGAPASSETSPQTPQPIQLVRAPNVELSRYQSHGNPFGSPFHQQKKS